MAEALGKAVAVTGGAGGFVRGTACSNEHISCSVKFSAADYTCDPAILCHDLSYSSLDKLRLACIGSKSIGNIVGIIRLRENSVTSLGFKGNTKPLEEIHSVFRRKIIESAVEKSSVADGGRDDPLHVAVIGNIAAAFAGDADFSGKFIILVENKNGEPLFKGSSCGHKSCGTAAHNYKIENFISCSFHLSFHRYRTHPRQLQGM